MDIKKSIPGMKTDNIKEDLELIDYLEERFSLDEAIELFDATKDCYSFRLRYIFSQVMCDIFKARYNDECGKE